jgi:proteasome lid subunit RPN8/RPN11
MAGEVVITRVAAEFILHAAKSTYPEEFAGLLRKNRKGEISEVLLVPQTVFGEDFSAINLYNTGYTSGHSGSVHSHPGRSALPSDEDLRFFEATGEVHIIVGYPYNFSSMRAYDSRGKRLLIKIA